MIRKINSVQMYIMFVTIENWGICHFEFSSLHMWSSIQLIYQHLCFRYCRNEYGCLRSVVYTYTKVLTVVILQYGTS